MENNKTMNILVLGADGYIGFPLVCNLASKKHTIIGVDNHYKRDGNCSVTKIASIKQRTQAINDHFPNTYQFIKGDITNYDFLQHLINKHNPDTIVNLAQIPSAPFSMSSIHNAQKVITNNEIGTLNLLWAIKNKDIPLVQIASMGEYQFVCWDCIPDGFIEVSYQGKKEKIPIPKDPLDFYHASKVNMTTLTILASKIWNLHTTEIYQGIVYGINHLHNSDPRLLTRFDIDERFGTIINRFTAQAAINHPLTVYGKGGQQRPFLSLKDSIRALTLAIEKPPKENYRAINQFSETYSAKDLANLISTVAKQQGLTPKIKHLPNPRSEPEDDYHYNPDNKTLRSLGFNETTTVKEEVTHTIPIIHKNKDRINKDCILPKIQF